MITEKQKKFLQRNERLSTPFQVVDLSVVEEKYRDFERFLPNVKIYYAIKSNPHDAIVKKLIDLNSCFDAASLPEIEQALRLGAKPEKISFGSTIKKSESIRAAYDLGIRLFAIDSIMELEKLAQNTGDAAMVYCRLLHTGSGAGFPLNAKFGTDIDDAVILLLKAKELGLKPRGVSFHVGSQAKTADTWISGLENAKMVFDITKDKGLMLDFINMGGGFPARYQLGTGDELDKIGPAISKAIKDIFGEQKIEFLVEPGRGLIAEAALSVTEVILSSYKKESGQWLYLDLGLYNGLFESFDTSLQHKYTPLDPHHAINIPMILAGPTCDSWDTFYGKIKVELPKDLKPGDRLMLENTGAYSASIATQNFNGFEPIKVHVLE